MKKRTLFPFLILFLVVIPLFSRLFYLRADLPSTYQAGTQNCDEGPWMHNARNKILFGKWYIKNDEWNPIFITPLYTFSLYLFFYIFGVGIITARLMSVFFSLISIILFYMTLKNEFNRKVAIIGTFLLSYNFIYLILSRAAMLDIFSTFFVILTFYFFQKSVKKRRFLVLAGIVSFLAFLAKASTAPFLPAVFFSTLFLVYNPSRKKDFKYNLKTFSYLIFGWLIVALIYLFTFFIPFYDMFKNMFIKNFFINYPNLPALVYSFNLRIFKIMTLGFEKPFFVRMPIVSLTAFLFLIIIIGKLLQKYKDVSPMNFFAFNWIFFSFVFFFLAEDNTPLRRMIFMIPVIVFLSAQLLSNFKLNPSQFKPTNKTSKLIMPVLYFIFIYNIIANILKYGFFKYSNFMVEETINFFLGFNLPPFSFNAAINFLSVVSSICITTAIFISYFIFRSKFKKMFSNILYFVNKKSRLLVAITLISVFLICFFQFYTLVVRADDSYYRASIDLGKKINNVKIQGFVSSCFITENQNIPVYVVQPYTNYADRFNRPDVPYFMLVLERDYGVDTKKKMRDEWLGQYPNSTLVWSYNLSDREQSKVGLFKKN